MGIFDGILKIAAPLVGTFLGGPVGGALASGIVSGMQEDDVQQSVSAQNAANMEMSQKQMNFQAQSNLDAMHFNEHMADKQMGFQQYNADTVNQRATADLAAAGLNPMLALGRPSPAPAGASAGIGGASGSTAHMEAPRMAAITTAATLAKISAEIEKTQADTQVSKSQALVNAAQIPRIEQDTRTLTSTASHLDAQTKYRLEELRTLLPEQVFKAISEIERNNAGTNLTQQQYFHEIEKRDLTQEEIKHAKAAVTHLQLGIPHARNVSNVQDTWWMKNVSPFLTDTVRGVTSGVGLDRILRRGR